MTLPRVLLIGDSQLEGLSPHLRGALDAQFQVVAIDSMPGASTRVVVDSGKIRNFVSSQHPDLVVFVLGGNDTAGASSVQAQTDAVRQAQAHGADVVWIGPALSLDSAVNARHAGVTAQLSNLMPQLGVRFLDSRAWANAGWGPDDVHFTREAYAAQAQAIARALEAHNPLVTVLAVGAGLAGLAGLAALVVHFTHEE